MANPLLETFNTNDTNTKPLTATKKTDGFLVGETVESAVHNEMFKQLFAAANKNKNDGVWEWDANLTYNKGSMVSYLGEIYQSLVGSNTATPTNDTLNWVNVKAQSIALSRGFKNYIINGNFDVWQRGTDFLTLGAFGGYTADRFILGNATGCQKYVDTVEGNTIFYPSAKVGAGLSLFFNPIELTIVGNNSQFTVGKTFTLSVRYKSTSRIKPEILFRDSSVGNQTTATTTIFNYKGGSGAYQTVSWTFPITGTCSSTDNNLSFMLISESQADVYVSQVQLEEGSIATPFEKAEEVIEEIRCKQSYWNSLTIIAQAVTDSATPTIEGLNYYVRFPVKMKRIPSVSVFNPSTGTSGQIRGIATGSSIGASVKGITNEGVTIYNTEATIVGRAYSFTVKVNAELY